MKTRATDFMGKIIVSEETGKKFGVVGDVKFVAESGELLSIVLQEATKQSTELRLEKDDDGRILVPFSSVKSVGDFVIVSEREVV